MGASKAVEAQIHRVTTDGVVKRHASLGLNSGESLWDGEGMCGLSFRLECRQWPVLQVVSRSSSPAERWPGGAD
jgi:hypothetical protein